MKWTDVNEALPDMKQRVLVVEQKHQGLRPCVYITKRISHDETDPNCTRWHWANCTNDSDVKFWCPLPAIPQSML